MPRATFSAIRGVLASLLISGLFVGLGTSAAGASVSVPTVTATATGPNTITVTVTYGAGGDTATKMSAFLSDPGRTNNVAAYWGLSPSCNANRSGSEASTSCTITYGPGTWNIEGLAWSAGNATASATTSVKVLGRPAFPADQYRCGWFECGSGYVGAAVRPQSMDFTHARFTQMWFGDVGSQNPANDDYPYTGKGLSGLTSIFAFNPSDSSMFLQCGTTYAIFTSASRATAGCAANANNTKVADKGSSANQVGQNLGGLAVDTSGNLYVSDQSNSRIAKWAKNAITGTTVGGSGTAGSALNQVSNPSQIAVDASGNVYVADTGNNRVLEFPAGSTSSTNGTVVAGGNGSGGDLNQLKGPKGLAVDASGNVYVGDSGNCRIVKWAPGASVGTLMWGQDGCSPWGQLPTGLDRLTLDTTRNYLWESGGTNSMGYATGFIDLSTSNYVQMSRCWVATGNPQTLDWENYFNSWVHWGDDFACHIGSVLDVMPSGQIVMQSPGSLNNINLKAVHTVCDIPKSKLQSIQSNGIGIVGVCKFPASSAWPYNAMDVSFYNAFGESSHRSFILEQPQGAWSAPAPVAKPTLTPKYKALRINWDAPATSALAGPANAYEVTLKDASGATAGTCKTTAPDTSCVISGLDPKVKYTATVVAKSPGGSAKASAASAPASPYDLPAAPAAPTATALARSAKVTFTAPSTANGGPATSYTVTAGPGGATCTVDAPATSCIVPGLTPGTHYTFTVAATNDGGTGPSSLASNDVVPFDNPSKPSKPTLTAGDGGVVVKGSVSSSDGGSPITGYTATIYDGDGNAVGSCGYVDPAIGCSVPGLDNGSAYTAKVVAHNAGGDSIASDSSSSATPSGVPTAPPNLQVSSTGDGTVDLSWDAPASNGGSSISGYQLTYGPAGGSCVVDNSARTAHCTGMKNGQAYGFNVAASNATGSGPISNDASGTPATTPSAPTGVTIKAGNGTVTVTWKKSASDGGKPITGYTVTVGGKTCVVKGTSCTITGLTNGTAVSAVVKATNAIGDSPDSATSASATPSAPAGVPTAPHQAPTATAGNGKLDVSLMEYNPLATGVVFTAGPGGQSCVAKAFPWKCTIPGLDNGTAYTVTAAFTNAKGAGSQSAASNSATPLGPPSAPLNLVAKGTNGHLGVTWDPPASDGGSAITGYTVTVKDAKGKVVTTCAVEDPRARTCDVTGLSTTETYVVEVTAKNDVGTGPKATIPDAMAPVAFNSLTSPTTKMQVAVGDHGQVFRSADAGAHWSTDASPTLANLRSVSCGGGGTFCMAVGDGGAIITWDAAANASSAVPTWKVLDGGTSTDLNGVFCIVDGACIAVGDSSTVAISDPQPAKAAPTTIKVNNISDVIPGNANAVTCTNPKAPAKPACVIGGDGGKLVAVKWSGTQFGTPSVLSVSGVTSDITALRCSVDTNCVAVGKAGLVLSGTKDITVAKSWKKLGVIKGFDATKDLRGVACPALSQLCIAVGNAGSILISTPKKPAGPGTTGWTPLTGQVSYDLTNVRCVSTTACLGIGGGHLLQVVQDKKGKWTVRQVV